jgi:hypothetical protein
VCAYNPRTWEGWELKANLGYTARYYLKKKEEEEKISKRKKG